MAGWDTIFISLSMRMKAKPACVSLMKDGRKKMTFMLSALSVGDDLWKACANIARPVKANPLEIDQIFPRKDVYFLSKYLSENSELSLFILQLSNPPSR